MRMPDSKLKRNVMLILICNICIPDVKKWKNNKKLNLNAF